MNEFERIDRFVRQFTRVPRAPFGPGDDAAVLPPTRQATCVTTDAVVEGVHFTRPAFSLEDVGHKALAVNLSDLAAMGASPRWALCALGLPADFSSRNLTALARGMAPLAARHGVSLLGGNLTRAPVLCVTLTVGGVVPPRRRALLRSEAKPGHRLYLSGSVGDASAGLAVIQRGGARTQYERFLLQAQKRPAPHLAWSLAAAPFASAAIDVSDGLAQDLGHLCRASGVGAELHTIPLSAALLRWAPSLDAAEHHALHGGEDYVVLAAVAEARVLPFERAMAAAGLAAHAIGRTTSSREVTLRGRSVQTNRGHQHFG